MKFVCVLNLYIFYLSRLEDRVRNKRMGQPWAHGGIIRDTTATIPHVIENAVTQNIIALTSSFNIDLEHCSQFSCADHFHLNRFGQIA